MNIGLFSGQPVSAYAVMVVAGCVAALLYVLLASAKHGLDPEDSIYIFVPGFLGMAVGAKLLYLLVSIHDLLQYAYLLQEDPRLYFRTFLTGGFVFYGGLFGVILGAYAAARFMKKDVKQYIPVYVPALCLFHICGRIGCYLQGCCYGKDGIPVQLMETAGVLVFLIWFLLHDRRDDWKDPEEPLLYYLAGYAILRFLLEFLRADAERGFIGMLSVSQWISIGVLAFLFLRRMYRKSRG